MDRDEALAIANERLEMLRQQSYQELQRLMTDPEVDQVIGPSGTRYFLEWQAVWDHKKGGDLRVIVDITDKEMRPFRIIRPLTIGFIIAPDGSFVGE